MTHRNNSQLVLPMMAIHRHPPVWVFEVVASSFGSPIPWICFWDWEHWSASPLNVALGSHKEGGAVLGNQRGCCVDQRKSVCNLVLCQAVLFCQESAQDEIEYAKFWDKGEEQQRRSDKGSKRTCSPHGQQCPDFQRRGSQISHELGANQP